MAALVQRHHRHAGDRLGHRVQPPDRVVGHRHGAFAILQAEAPEVPDDATAHHGHLRAGDLAGLDVAAAEVVGDPPEPRLVEPGTLGVHLHVRIPFVRRREPPGWHGTHRERTSAPRDARPTEPGWTGYRLTTSA